MKDVPLIDRKEPWHLRKEVTVGNLLTTATVVCGMAFYVVDIDKRVTRIEAQREETVRRLASIEAGVNELRKDINRLIIMQTQMGRE